VTRVGEGSWLGGKRAALALTIPVDCETMVLAQGRRHAGSPLAMSHQVYEVNRGVPRLLSMLADLGIAATFYIPGWTLERHPQLAEAVLTGGHELAHHSYSHRKPTELTPAEEREDFERALATLRSFGVEPAGHRAASWSAGFTTLELVAEHGLLYDSSLMGHDRPYRVVVGGAQVVELPPHWALDDFDHYAYLPDPFVGRNVEAPQTVAAVWREELDGMREYGGLCQLTCHAFLSGRPGRALALRGLLEYALGCGDVDLLTCAEVAQRAARDPDLDLRPYAPVTAHAEVEPVPLAGAGQ